MKYRAEIDGLRALAVVPAILFHAGFDLFNGGFVGVDVFFVISGFLITTILIEDIENNRFSIVNFYVRRARRILPALFFVMLVCIPFAWMWMLPNQMAGFSRSLVAVSLFASNVLFWRESGYFAAAAGEMPLLHTWSLAVEEQYYLLFPIFLFLAWRFGKNRVFWMIVVSAAISLALSEWNWRNSATANFYLAPTRVWELFAGSIAAFIVQKRGVRANNALSLIGLIAIIFAIFAFDETTPFPSLYALVPVVCVVLLILFAEKKTLAAKLLSTRAFVGIGLISYSAYLWHQPLFAFARVKLIEEPSIVLMGVLSLLSMLLAILSWKFIEQPFRKYGGKRLRRKEILTLSISGILLMSALGYLGHKQDGFPQRWEVFITAPNITDYDTYYENLWNLSYPCTPEKIFIEAEIHDGVKRCMQSKEDGRPDLVLLGDSHAEHLYYGLAVSQPNLNVGYYNKGKPFLSNPNYGDIFLELRENNHAQVVVVAMHYRNISRQKIRDELSGLIEFLISSNKRVLVLGDNPYFDVPIGDCIYYKLEDNPCIQNKDELLYTPDHYKDILTNLSQHYSVPYIDIFDAFCEKSKCSSFDRKGSALYQDRGHLNEYGSLIAAEYLKKDARYNEYLRGLQQY